jgi:hypothetical protein
MKTDKKEIEGKLIIDDLSENAHRVRRNLLIFSFVAIFYKLSGASISENGVSFYGINFQHIDENFISIGIFSIVFYHLFHFSLIIIAHWSYLRIRVTRNNGGVVAPGMYDGGGFDGPDYLANTKDSSLYHWHCQHASSLKKAFLKTQKEAEKLSESESEEIIKKKLNDIQNGISSFDRLRKSKRFIKSLTKFDNYLRCYRGVELFRWIVIEFAAPVLAGIVALGLLYSHCDFAIYPWNFCKNF